MDGGCNGPVVLLDLPPEIRLQILRQVIESYQPDVSQDGRMCNVAGVIGTCRKLFLESTQILYASSLISFSCADAFLAFHIQRQAQRSMTGYSLSLLRNVLVDCGAAKHSPSAVSRSTLRMLRLLAREAETLKQLHLRVSYFYQAPSSDIPLASKLIKAIGSFRDLSTLTLTMGTPPPGPFDCDSMKPDALKKLSHRVYAMELVFCRYTCNMAPLSNPFSQDHHSSRLDSMPHQLTNPAHQAEQRMMPKANNFVTQFKAEVMDLLRQPNRSSSLSDDG